jgi:hypothetical protein
MGWNAGMMLLLRAFAVARCQDDAFSAESGVKINKEIHVLLLYCIYFIFAYVAKPISHLLYLLSRKP